MLYRSELLLLIASDRAVCSWKLCHCLCCEWGQLREKMTSHVTIIVVILFLSWITRV